MMTCTAGRSLETKRCCAGSTECYFLSARELARLGRARGLFVANANWLLVVGRTLHNLTLLDMTPHNL